MRREGAGGEEVVAAAALEAANQLTHVRRVVVLGGARRAQLRRPKREFTLWGPIPVQKTSFDHMSPKYITKTFKEVFKGPFKVANFASESDPGCPKKLGRWLRDP